MNDAAKAKRLSARQSPIYAATAELRRQFRIRNFLLCIVAVEALAFIAVRSWSLL